MSGLADRLRGIVAAVPGSAARERYQRSVAGHGAGEGDYADAAEVLGGQWIESAGHRVLVVDRLYRPGHRHGHLVLVDHVLPENDAWLRVFLSSFAGTRIGGDAVATRCLPVTDDGSGRTAVVEGPRTIFIDLETSGLAGGAGTYAFLVGCAWFEHCSLRVRQFFMSSASAEASMLTLLEALAGSVELVVSFNGKSFDLPLIETRYVMHRRQSPFAEVPHLDMLHPARRLWRRDEADSTEGIATSALRATAPTDAQTHAPEFQNRGGCSLTALEGIVCGHTREGDVPGFEIPARYFHYVRSGDAAPLASVFEHNRLDLLSLAFLTARAAQLASDEMPQLTTAREAVGLGQLLERAGDVTRARRCYARAASADDHAPLPGDDTTRAEAMHAYAVLCRRDRRYADAAAMWRQLLQLRRCPPGLARTASEALAIHHEHRLRDFRTARAFALKSADLQVTPLRRQALEHRLARIDRKLVAEPLRLF